VALTHRRKENKRGGRGTTVVDVAAPPKAVWDVVLDFNSYGGRLGSCKRARIYETRLEEDVHTIKAHLVLDGYVKEFNAFYEHLYRPAESLLTWSLDPNKDSDFVDVQGQWCVDAHPDKGPTWSRVWYSTDVAVPGWLPRFVVRSMCKTGGIKALDFAKKYAEAAARSENNFNGPSSSSSRKKDL